MITEPLATMQAALIALGNGEASEIEMSWSNRTETHDEALTITVRREVTVLVNEGEDE